jgi:hypothetical protein
LSFTEAVRCPFWAYWRHLAPGLQVVKLVHGRQAVKTIRQFGPLPDIRIPAVDYLTLTFAILPLVAAILELFRLRMAAPLALVAVAGLWIYYIPGIWDETTGNMWFAMKLGRTTGISWQNAHVSDHGDAVRRDLDVSPSTATATLTCPGLRNKKAYCFQYRRSRSRAETSQLPYAYRSQSGRGTSLMWAR